MTEAASFADRVIETEDQIAQRDRLARGQPELARRAARREGGNRKELVGPDASLIERLEGQIQRHHLGQRRRIGKHVGILLAQHLAGLRVEQYPGEDRPGHGGRAAARMRLGREPAHQTERDGSRQDRRADKPYPRHRAAGSPPLFRHYACTLLPHRRLNMVPRNRSMSNALKARKK